MNKKYLGFLVVGALIIFITAPVITKAEDGEGEDSAPRAKAPLNPGEKLTPEQKLRKDNLEKNKLEDINDNHGDDQEEGNIRIPNSKIKGANDQTINQNLEPKDKIAELRGKISNEKDSKKKAVFSNRVEALVKWKNAVDRIKGLEDRLNSAVVRADKEGVDTTSAKAGITLADTKIVSITVNVETMKTALAGATVPISDSTKATMKKLMDDTQKLVIEANDALQKALKDLKDSLKAKRQATANPEEGKSQNNNQ